MCAQTSEKTFRKDTMLNYGGDEMMTELLQPYSMTMSTGKVPQNVEI